MKKNRTLLGVALVIALLVLGIGYAWDTLSPTVKGTATISANEDNFVVALANPTVGNSDAGNTFTVDGLTGTLTVKSLKSVGETVTATVEVINNSDIGIKAKVTDDTVAEQDTGNYFTVTTDWVATELASNGGKKLMTITVKLDKAPIAEATGTFEITMDATAEAE